MRSPIAWLLLVLAAVAAGFALWWNRAEAPRAILPEAPAAVSAAPVQVDGAAPADAVASPRAALEGTSGEGAARQAPPGALRVRVRVVDGATRAPVPRAEVGVMAQVFSWDTMSDADRYRVRHFGADRVGLLSAFGRKHRADAEGFLELGIVKDLFLACEHDGRFGELTLHAGKLGAAAVHELRLFPASSLRVRVTGPDDLPVPGMPILVQLHWSDAGLNASLRQRGALGIRGYTGPDGIAVLRNVQTWTRTFAAAALPQRFGLGLDVLGARQEQAAFDLDALPQEVVELKAPATGAVLVRLRDDRGEPLGSHEDCRLQLVEDTKHDYQPWHAEPGGPGAGRFPFVALGQMLRASAAHGAGFAPKEVPGPTRQGEVVHVDLVADAAADFLAGQILDHEGRPAPRMHLRMDFEAEGYSGAWFRILTEPGGRFRYPLGDDFIGVELRAIVVQQIAGVGDRAPFVAVLDRPVTVKKGRNELGAVRLQQLPVLASGTVVVDGVPPAQHPALAVEERRGDGWVATTTVVVAWEGAGRFDVRGLACRAGHRLRVDAPGCLPVPPLPFHAGAEDLRVQLRTGGSLRAVFLVGEPQQAEHLFPELLDAVGAARPPDERRAAAGEPPSFAWQGLEPGAYRLRLALPGRDAPVVDLGDLAVPAGGACEDPRLRVDLREVARFVTLTFSAPDGAATLSGAVWSGVGPWRPGCVFFGPRATVLVAGTADLNVAVQGFATQLLRGVDGDRQVQLAPWPTVALTLPEVALPDGVRATLRGTCETGALDRSTVRTTIRGPAGRGLPVNDYTQPRVRFELGAGQTVAVPVRPGNAVQLGLSLSCRSRFAEVSGVQPARLRAGDAPATLSLPAAFGKTVAEVQK